MPKNAVSKTWTLPTLSGRKWSATAASKISGLWAHDGGDKVFEDELRQTNPPSKYAECTTRANAVWNGTTVSVFGARNEVVQFCLVLESLEGVEDVGITFDTLTHSGGAGTGEIKNTATLTTDDDVFKWVGRPIEIFVAKYTQLRSVSMGLTADFARTFMGMTNTDTDWLYPNDPNELQAPFFWRVPQTVPEPRQDWWGTFPPDKYQKAAPGMTAANRPCYMKWIPDALVPIEVHRPVRGGVKVEASKGKFDIGAGKSQMVWFDVYVPKGTATGTYNGTITIRVGANIDRTVPVSFKVRGITLPDVPTHKWGLIWEYVDSWFYIGQQYASTPAHTTALDARAANTFRMIHRHKLCWFGEDNNSVGGGLPWSPNSSATFLPGPFTTPYMTGTGYSAASGYDGPGVDTPEPFYCGIYGSWKVYNNVDAGVSVNAINDATRAAVVTITTQSDHGLTAGGTVRINEMPTNWTALNGTHTVVSVPTTKTFTLAVNTSGYATAYTKGAGFIGTPIDGPGKLWPALNAQRQWFLDRGLSNTECILYVEDETGQDRFRYIKHVADVAKANPGVGNQVKIGFTCVLIDAIYGDTILNASNNIRNLDIYWSGVGANGSRAGHPSLDTAAAAAWVSANGKQLWNYNGGSPGFGCLSTDFYGVAPRYNAWANMKLGLTKSFFWHSNYVVDYQSHPWIRTLRYWATGGAVGPHASDAPLSDGGVLARAGMPGAVSDVYDRALTYGGKTQDAWGTRSDVNKRAIELYGIDAPGPFVSHSNGDGLLFYPGKDLWFQNPKAPGINGPVFSIRLKNLRRGVQDYDYFAQAKVINATAANAIVATRAPQAGWEFPVSLPVTDGYGSSPGVLPYSYNPNDYVVSLKALADIIDPAGA